MNSLSSDVAPRKFEPLSEYMVLGHPLRFVNLRIELRNESVSAVSTISRCTHLTVRQVNKTIHRFKCFLPSLTSTGPVRSTPQCVKGASPIAARPSGKSAIFGRCLFARRILQKKHNRIAVLMATLADRTQYFSFRSESTCSRPTCPFLRCSHSMRRRVMA